MRWGVTDQGADVEIEECTRPIILKAGSRNGVQHNPLGDTLSNYGHGAIAAALILSDEARARRDVAAYYEFIGKCDGIVTYDVSDLFKFLLREIPIIGAREWQEEDYGRMVCSGFVTASMIADRVLGAGIDWAKWAPEDVVKARIYSHWIPLLGNPKLVNFNTL